MAQGPARTSNVWIRADKVTGYVVKRARSRTDGQVQAWTAGRRMVRIEAEVSNNEAGK